MKFVVVLINTDNCTYTDYIPLCLNYKSKEEIYKLIRIRIKEALEAQEGFSFGGESWSVFDNIYISSTSQKQLIKNPELALVLSEEDISIKVYTLEEWFINNKVKEV